MRKALAFLLIILIPAIVFAGNGLKIIPLESDVYSAVDALYVLEGKALPSTTRPWTANEAALYLSKVSRETSPALYDIVLNAVEEKPSTGVDEIFGMTFGLKLSATVYAHTEKSFNYQFNGMTNYLFSSENETPPARVSWESWAGEHFYSYVWYQYKLYPDGNKFSSYSFNFDLPNLTPEGFTSDMDQREPSRAFAVAGGKGWSLETGRDRLQMGTGETGSLILSNTFPYHNLLRFSLYGSRYKYSFIMSFLPHMSRDEEHGLQENGGLLFYMTHRFECTFLADRLYAAINESIMYKDDGGVADMRYINPVMYFHNYFISTHANSIVDLELSYALAKGWNVYFQFALDQFATPWEVADGDDVDPLAFGALLGLRSVSAAGKGILTVNLEAAYTMPYLYLRATQIADEAHVQDVTDPGLGYIGSYRGKRFFVGYTFGNDALVFDFKGTYEVPSDLKLSAEFFFMVDGQKTIDSLFDEDDASFAPSGDCGIFWYAELYGKKKVSKRSSIYGQYDLIFNAGTWDNQFVLGIEIEF